MRFDPKLIRPDDAPVGAGGEVQLPDDLAALAQQLQDDARHLSHVYPPARTTKTTARRWRTRWSVTASLTGVVAVALFLVFALWSEPAPETRPQKSPARPAHALVSVPPRETTPVSLSELSPPELEAVLDMLEHDNTRPLSVAF